jgi:hypothetical protein
MIIGRTINVFGTAINLGCGSYHIVDLVRLTTGTDTAKARVDDGTWYSGTIYIPVNALKAAILERTSCDWIFFRQCLETEPSWGSWGSEEEVGGNDEYTKLLLHMNGTDGSTSFIDSSASTHTVTATGDAQIDTAQSKFGGASGLFDGSGDYLSLADSSDWYFGTGDFTIDFWVRWDGAPGSRQDLCGQIGDSYNKWYFCWQAGGYLELYVKVSGSTKIDVKAMWNPSTATCYHIAIVRYGTTFKIFVDGVDKPSSGGTDSDAMPDIASELKIGTAEIAFKGWIDEFRISKGIAPWTAAFTPPAFEYTAPSSSTTEVEGAALSVVPGLSASPTMTVAVAPGHCRWLQACRYIVRRWRLLSRA